MNLFKPFLVFKTYHNGYWYQARNTFTNMNIFTKIMSTKMMIDRTLGEDCAGPGDYLRLIFFCSFVLMSLLYFDHPSALMK